MEVTKSGIKPSTWRHELICPRCEAHLRISRKDIFIKTSTKETLFSYKHVLNYYIDCPECGCRIKLNEEKLPYVIKKAIFDNMDIVERLLNFYFS